MCAGMDRKHFVFPPACQATLNYFVPVQQNHDIRYTDTLPPPGPGTREKAGWIQDCRWLVGVEVHRTPWIVIRQLRESLKLKTLPEEAPAESTSAIMHHSGKDNQLGETQFGVTFFSSSQRQDICGTNGLPLTPNSIRILGRSQYLKPLFHPNLCQYIDIIRGKHERIVVVSEHFKRNLSSILKSDEKIIFTDPNKLIQIAKSILESLVYLNQHGIANRNISLENIQFTKGNAVKMFNYGLHYMTNCGKYISFPIGDPKYTAPEVFLDGMKKGPSIYSCDVWSLGIVLVELVIGKELWADLKLHDVTKKVIGLNKSEDAFRLILEDHKLPDIIQEIDPCLRLLIQKCLETNPAKRSWPKALLAEDAIFDPVQFVANNLLEPGIPSNCCYAYLFQSAQLTLEQEKYKSVENIIQPQISRDDLDTKTQTNGANSDSTWSFDFLGQRTLKEVYYLWQLAGGDVIGELKRQGLTRKKPAVLTLPRSMTLEGKPAGKARDRGLLLDTTVILLPLDELRKRLKELPPEVYYPLVNSNAHMQLEPTENNFMLRETASLPLVIREKDIEYQFHRIILFDRLIKGYPFTKRAIQNECLQDVPPFFRAKIWSCLLGVKGGVEYFYNSIDKETATTTDRQIEVDIPRCHQYDELLSSPSGHQKFKRVLKAWVVNNKKTYVYWQGLDSLCAPFLYLNFCNEAMAFSCLSAFIPKYLYNFFLKDNSEVIQEYLTKFSQLIAFHDPQLTNHLDSIEFNPELYAIPWFLTMFSHVFPLHKIFHLWDKLLQGDSSFPLCIGLAILYQLRESLLSSGFNESILLFSDMPEVNIEKCVKDSVEIYCNTPASTLCRKHEPVAAEKSVDAIRRENSSQSAENRIAYLGGRLSQEALKMEAIPLAELKKEKCVRISGEDVLQLLDLNASKYNKSKVLVVDVRNREDFNRGAIPGSINMPFITAFNAEGALIHTEEVNTLNANRGKTLIVVGNRGDSATKFADKILRLEYPRICVLHRGIDIFRSGNILAVPSTI